MIQTVKNGENEIVIKKSRFIGYSFRIDSRADAADAVLRVRKEHPLARHVCHAFIADEKGDDYGYDDDGEPSGTAGKPIYSALQSAGVRKSLIAVVRYFGGIKLGAGGLTRAYRRCAAELMEGAGLAFCDRRAVYDIECDGDLYKKVQSVVCSSGGEVQRIVFNARAECTVAVPYEFDLSTALSALGVTAVKTGERYVEIDG